MTSNFERAADMLFPADGGPRTLNIKFLCAGVENINVEAIAEQIVRSEVQIRNGSARLVTNLDGHLTPNE